MNKNLNRLGSHLLAAVVLSLAGACGVSAGGQIPCADDSSCPKDYPVCSAGKCAAGTVASAASVTIVAVDGHLPADMVRGTVTVAVTARAASGVSSVTLGGGSKTYTPATSSAPPLYRFDVPTTDFADSDVPLTATITAGDGTTAHSAVYTLHIDNTPPVVTSPAGSTPLLSQVIANSGTVLFVDLTVNEPATLAATATSGTKVFPLGEVDSGTAGVRRLQFAVGGTTPTGSYTVSIVATDRAGNQTTLSDSTATPLHFNVTAPLNVTMAVAGHLDVSSNKIKINGIPAATVGDAVKAVVTLPAGVSFGSGFPHYKVIKPDASSVSFAPNSDGSGSFTIVSGEQQGVFTFHADVQDAAGSPATIEAPFLVQTDAPQVVGGNWSKTLGSNGGAGTLTFAVAVSEPIAVSINGTATLGNHTNDTIRLTDGTNTYFNAVTTNGIIPTIALSSGTPSPCSLCVFTFSGLTKTASSIAFTPVLNIADAVGNTTVATQTGITYTNDTVAPDFVAGLTASPAVVGTNVRSGVVTVTGTASKALQSVSFSSNEPNTPESVTCTLDPATRTKVACTLTINDVFNSSTLGVNVTINPLDLAGNDKTNGATPAHYTTSYLLDNVTLTSGSAVSPSLVALNQIVTMTGAANKATLASATVAVSPGSGNGSCTVNTPVPGQWKCLITATTVSATSTDTATVTLTDTAGNQATPSKNYNIDNRAPMVGALTTSTTLPLVTGGNGGATLNWTPQAGGANCTTTGACFISTSTNGSTKKITDNNSGTYPTTSSACVSGGDCLSNPTVATTYTLTVTGVNGQVVTSSVLVTVAPQINTFTAPATVTAAPTGTNATLTIQVTGVDCRAISHPCTVAGSDASNANVTGGTFVANVYNGTLDVLAPTGGATYTLSAKDVGQTPNVTTTASRTINVLATPTFSGTFSTPSLTGGGAFTQIVFTMPTMNGTGGTTPATFKDNGTANVQKPGTSIDYTPAEIFASSGTSLNVKPPTTSATGTTPQSFTYTLLLQNSATTPGASAPLTTAFVAFPKPTVTGPLAAGGGMPTSITAGSAGTYTLTLPTVANVGASTGTVQLVDAANSNSAIVNNATGLPFTLAELTVGGTVIARLPPTVATAGSNIVFQVIARNLASDAVASGTALSNTLTLHVVPATATDTAIRLGASATLLPNGNVLIAGGSASALDVNGDCQAAGGTTTSVIFNPTTGAVTPTVHAMSQARCQHTAVTVGTNVYMIGGSLSLMADVFDTTVSDFKFTSLPTVLVNARTRHTSTVVGSNVYSIGGVTPGTATLVTTTHGIERFVPATPAAAEYTVTSSQLQVARASHVAFIFGSTNIVVVGGAGASATADIFDSTRTPTQNNAVSDGTSNNAAARNFAAAATLSGGKILIVGGVDGAGAPLFSGQLYDPGAAAGSRFSTLADATVAGHTRFPMIAFGTDKAALFGGTGNAFDIIEIFDNAASPKFSAYRVLSSARTTATATSVTGSFTSPAPNHEVWVVGGGAAGTAGAIETVTGP